MMNQCINKEKLNQYFSAGIPYKAVYNMDVPEIPKHLLDLKKSLYDETNNRLDRFEKAVLALRKYRILNKGCNVDELNVKCIYCNKDINYNNTRTHMKQKTHNKNKTIYYNNKLKISDVDSENVLHIEA